ncbi:MAG: FABP family protein [Actinomycetota bacterium]
MTPAPESPAIHTAVKPLAYLLGTWRGEGHGSYPTIEDFHYGEEITFRHNGKAFLSYSQRSWSLDDGRPLAAEFGFWRPQADGTIEVVMSHPTGINEIYVGTFEGRKIELATDLVARTATAKEVTAMKRLYGMVGVELMYAIDMAAMGLPLQSHLAGTLNRIGD